MKMTCDFNVDRKEKDELNVHINCPKIDFAPQISRVVTSLAR